MEHIGVVEKETTTLHALRKDTQSEIFGHYSAQDRVVIRQRQQVLSSLAYFIGKDFQIPVELNEPGAGWHWNFKENKIRVDPKDLLEKPMDYLRFVISHEGGHRRISRTEDIPVDVWRQPGFSFMMNAIEDPRTNNFVAEAYPRFAKQMDVAYQSDLDFEGKAKEKAHEKLGYTPRFIQAGFEYIKQWYKETQGDTSTILSEDLPKDVKGVVQTTLNSARDSWLRYPSRQEADRGEGLIRKYANVSYEINRDEVWPEFKKLVDADMEDQKMQEFMKDMQGDGKEGNGQGLPQDLKDKLTEKEQQELAEAMQNNQSNSKEGDQSDGNPRPIDLDSLSDDLKQKIKNYIDSLPEDAKRELAEKAKKALEDFEKKIDEEFEGKLSDNPNKKSERHEQTRSGELKESRETTEPRSLPEDAEEQRKFRDLLEKALRGDENAYESMRREVLPQIDELEADLREIFVKRRAQKWLGGFKSGKKIDIKRRMQEKALGISSVESKAWQKRELPSEKDYAISLLVDLSGSMRGEKIEETFKATIVLAEVLNRLSINTEILGFNDKLYPYQSFGQDMSQEVRKDMGNMLEKVHSQGAAYNDDGWAVREASERLSRQKVDEKFLLVLSDGLPEESDKHPRSKYNLEKVIAGIMERTDQKLIGLGVGPGTDHVERYYPNSVANIGIREMPDKLADVIREAIANYNTF
jgi:cobalamin biosynthesis protein CobT